MPFYEIIYEPGTRSVAFYEDDDEAQRALSEHHRRAISGEPGTPQSHTRSDLSPGEVRTVGTWPAERIKRVLKYDDHPGSFMEDHIVEEKDLKDAFNAALKESSMQGAVHAPTIAAVIRDTSSPIIKEPAVHESQYKAKEDSELNLQFLKDLEA